MEIAASEGSFPPEYRLEFQNVNSARSRNFDEIPHNPADLVALQDRSGFPYYRLEEKIAINARAYEVLEIFPTGLDHAPITWFIL